MCGAGTRSGYAGLRFSQRGMVFAASYLLALLRQSTLRRFLLQLLGADWSARSRNRRQASPAIFIWPTMTLRVPRCDLTKTVTDDHFEEALASGCRATLPAVA